MDQILKKAEELVKKSIDKLVILGNDFSFLDIQKSIPSEIKYSQKMYDIIGKYIWYLQEKEILNEKLEKFQGYPIYSPIGLFSKDSFQFN